MNIMLDVFGARKTFLVLLVVIHSSYSIVVAKPTAGWPTQWAVPVKVGSVCLNLKVLHLSLPHLLPVHPVQIQVTDLPLLHLRPVLPLPIAITNSPVKNIQLLVIPYSATV